MDLDFSSIEALRRGNPAWRLLTANHAPLLISFFNKIFIAPNVRGIDEKELTSRLEDELIELKKLYGEDEYPKPAEFYLGDWAQDEKGWLRKYYPQGSDEAHFDLTPAAEKAIAWVKSLSGRSFVGTESRLRTVIELLRELVEGSRADPVERIRELKRQRKEIDARIARVQAGELELLGDTAVRERFRHMADTAREILGDFREVEQNFRDLDRGARERIASWEGSKGELLADILGRRDLIADSDQGKSFRAFWDFLMSPDRQDELGALLEAALALPAVRGLEPDGRIRRVHYDWMEAGERAQRTVAQLSRQLRRFLDDRAWLENRRIMDLIRSIEVKALRLRDDMPDGATMEISSASATIELPMDRPLFSPPSLPRLDGARILAGDEDFEDEVLYSQWVVDRALLRARVKKALAKRDQATLAQIVGEYPLERSLTELLAYFCIAVEDKDAIFCEEAELISWNGPDGAKFGAEAPRVIFSRGRGDNG
jgi:hypothetical protein